MARRHVVLVGLPGAGKTTVGRLVAERLGAPFIDVDRVIETRAGKSVGEIFAEEGEAAFRALEVEVGAELLSGAPAVISPGGGFFTDAPLRRRALEIACVLYLQTSPAEAARRLGGQADRPLLDGHEPVQRLRALLEQREAAYLEARDTVTTDDRSALEVADQVVVLACAHGGW